MRAQFVLSEIGVGLRRNLTMTFAVIVSVALSLALFGGALLMREQVNTMKDYWYDKVNVSIYLCTKADATNGDKCAKGAVTAEQKKQIEGDLKKLSIVENVYYESAEEAFSRYQEQYGDTAIASVITPDQMPESFRVKLKDPEKYKVVATAFEGRDGIESVQDQRNILETLFNMMRSVNYAAVALMLLMLVIALMLIINTVRVSAFSRRRETGIMRAAFSGLIGGAFACVLLVAGRYLLVDHGLNLAEQMPLVNFIGWDVVLAQLPLVIVIGLLMPSVAAFIALRKYLKV
ncbi:permease-like cell division protein FtsX [Streptomyces roseolus]|uniref:permease-like cell division protein FtsX n=1 Tax=Streptomyces roseolus TaxID=67358 RepID=UPI003646F8A5